MTDILTRLRCLNIQPPTYPSVGRLMNDAACEIERLRAELAEGKRLVRIVMSGRGLSPTEEAAAEQALLTWSAGK